MTKPDRKTGSAKPGGRPKKADGETRSELVAVRLTITEKAELDRRAGQAGLSPSEYLRHCVFRRRTPAGKAGTDPALVSELNRLTLETARIGNNLNQLARATHRDSAFQEFWREIGQEVRFTAMQVRRALEKVLDE